MEKIFEWPLVRKALSVHLSFDQSVKGEYELEINRELRDE
jgi:hypothetical protein